MWLLSAVSGAYLGVYTPGTAYFPPASGHPVGVPVGVLADDGYEIAIQPHGYKVNDTTDYGRTLIEGVFMGTDVRVRFRAVEWASSGLMYAAWPFATAGGAPMGPKMPLSLGGMSRRWTDSAGILGLVAVAGTPSAVTGPAAITANFACLSDGSSLNFALASKLRALPVELALLPYELPAPPPTTTIEGLSNGVQLPTGTIYVASVKGFAPSGSITIAGVAPDGGDATVQYQALDVQNNAFIGCSGGNGVIFGGDEVTGEGAGDLVWFTTA